MNIEILHRYTRAVLFSTDATDILAAVNEAIKKSANLTGADLTGANLRGADLSSARSDFLAEVLRLPNELEFLRDALVAGRVNGSSYNNGECGCLAGTLARAKGIEGYKGSEIKNGLTFHANASSPRERFFLTIRKGDTPENNGACKIAFDRTQEAMAIRDNIRESAKGAA